MAPELADGTLLDTVIAARGALATIETTQRASAVLSVAFSPDGQRFLSGGQDGTVRVWNADTDKPVGEPLTGHTGAVLSVAFSPDGQRFLSGSQDGTVRMWPGGRAAWRHELCAKLTTNMSRQQWNDWVSPKIPYSEVCPDCRSRPMVDSEQSAYDEPSVPL